MSRNDNRARKPEKDAEEFPLKATKSFQDNVTRSMPWAAASYTLIGAIEDRQHKRPERRESILLNAA